jgi:hypothetical protein
MTWVYRMLLPTATTKEGNNMKKFAGVLLLTIGSIALLVHFGRFFLLVLMVGLAFLGAKKLKHAQTKQNKNFAYLLLAIAAVCGLFIMPLLFTLLICGTLIFFGWKLLDPSSRTSFSESTVANHSFDSSFDADWKSFVEKNKN